MSPPDLDPLLAHHRASTEEMSAEELERLRRDVVQATWDAPLTLRERLRRLPTPVRAAVVVVVACALLLGMDATIGLRDDLTAADRSRVYGSLVSVFALGTLALVIPLRGVYRPPLRPAVRLGLLALLGVPILIGLVPTWWTGRDLPPQDLVQAHVACFLSGSVVAGVAASVTLLLDRSARIARWRVLAASAGGGLASFAVLGFHCYVGGMVHLALAHGLQGITIAGVLLLLTRRGSPS